MNLSSRSGGRSRPVIHGSGPAASRDLARAGASAMVKTTSLRRPRDGKLAQVGLGEPEIAARVAALDWAALAVALDAHGCATTRALLAPAECVLLRNLYRAEDPFRSRVIMARHGFGRGEYKYFGSAQARGSPARGTLPAP